MASVAITKRSPGMYYLTANRVGTIAREEHCWNKQARFQKALIKDIMAVVISR
jgi:hypothetical protein